MSYQLGLCIGGISTLIRSDSAPLEHIGAWAEPFVTDVDEPDILFEVVTGPLRGSRPHAEPWVRAQFERYFRRLFDVSVPLSESGAQFLAHGVDLAEQCWALPPFRDAWHNLTLEPDCYILLEPWGAGLVFLDRMSRRATLFVPDAGSLAGFLWSVTFYRYLQSVYSFLMCDLSGLVLHAAGVARAGNAYAFAGPSGSGKSTLARSLEGMAAVLADDALIVRELGGEFRAFATPWNSFNGGWATSMHAGISDASLAYVGFIYPAQRQRYERLDTLTATVRLLSNVMPELGRLGARCGALAFDFGARLCSTVLCHELHLVKGGDVWALIEGPESCEVCH